jgi:hypothetical protein
VRQPAIEPIVDLAMAPMLAAAIDGDAAARLFISHMLTKRADIDGAAKALAASWLEANRVAARVARTARSTKAKPFMRPPRSRRVMSGSGDDPRRPRTDFSRTRACAEVN